MARTVTERADALPALAEAFRRHGYEGASLAVLTQHTGLGKGSLYNFFPGGKEEMALAVLDEVDAWFRVNVYEPLRDGEVPVPERLQGMTGAVEDYFTSRHLVCLFGAFALGQERERFGERIAAYFTGWIDALGESVPRDDATDFVATVQGALVLARALDDPQVLHGTITRALTLLVRGRAG
ncbi:TetR/AcrR family transcriptional regulator [Kineosporia succinea]|uniref:AcrR family transcriptional regulator n=1 Tax=Kineosporia succinea TaxID=84632 RepID=A0ABT9PAW5_9ACTN|nr:TetR/AcrR family transcriptional regulator [Kineosporia succinea]MDP9829842.1 AcrR family transcriptional regulator [Kineosporia succinea]